MSEEANDYECSDGVDNNSNGLIDCEDPSCQEVLDITDCSTGAFNEEGIWEEISCTVETLLCETEDA